MPNDADTDARDPDERDSQLVDAARRQVRGEPGESAIPLGSEHLEADTPGARTTPEADSFAGYKIIREIHRGGQGVVYQVFQKSTKRMVAIKVMREGPFAGSADKARFDREVQILGQLKHPNIVTIHDSGETAGQSYFVMDYISGQPLDVYMTSGEHTIDDTLKLFGKICDAVNAAHLRGVIHRDLKPGNIRIDDNGEPFILDFGLAKVATTDAEASLMTMTGQFVGSLPWASPEQAEGAPGKVDIRTDVYSLGVILYQMLTGKFPYEVVGAMRDVLDRIIKAEPARPSTIRRQVNDEVETIVLKCLSKERDRRYQNAGELARDVHRYVSGEAIEAKRDSLAYILRKQLHKYKLPATIAGAFVIVVVAGFATSLAFWYRAAQERDRARLAERQEAAQRRQAEEHLEVGRAVKNLLQDTVLAADPTKLRGPRVTIAEALRAAAQHIDWGAYADRPEVESMVRATMGRTLRELGQYPAAEEHLRRALALKRELYSETHEAVADVLHNLVDVLLLQGKIVEAEQLGRQALMIDRAVYGAEHQNIAAALHNLASVLRAQNRFTEAEPLFREALEMQRRIFGPEDIQVASMSNGLSVCLKELDRLGEAEPLQREALALHQKLLARDHPDVLTSQINLAHLLILKEELAEAEMLLMDTLERQRRILPVEHPGLGVTLILLGAARIKLDRPTEAEPALRECLDIRQKYLPGHWLVGNTQSVLGECLAAQRRFDEAEQLLLDGYQAMSVQPAPPRRKREAVERIVRLYDEWRRTEEVERWRSKLREMP